EPLRIHHRLHVIHDMTVYHPLPLIVMKCRQCANRTDDDRRFTHLAKEPHAKLIASKPGIKQLLFGRRRLIASVTQDRTRFVLANNEDRQYQFSPKAHEQSPPMLASLLQDAWRISDDLESFLLQALDSDTDR